MEKSDRVKRVLKDHKIDILGDVRKVPEINITIGGDGVVAMSFDEYNRISEHVHQELKRKRNVRY